MLSEIKAVSVLQSCSTLHYSTKHNCQEPSLNVLQVPHWATKGLNNQAKKPLTKMLQ